MLRNEATLACFDLVAMDEAVTVEFYLFGWSVQFTQVLWKREPRHNLPMPANIIIVLQLLGYTRETGVGWRYVANRSDQRRARFFKSRAT